MLAPKLRRPGLVFGLVGAIGTNLDRVFEELARSLERAAYRAEKIKLSDLLAELPHGVDIDGTDYFTRTSSLIQAGNTVRERAQHGRVLVAAAILKIRELRERERADAIGVAYVVQGLKHAEEVKALREVYGESFHLISAYAPRADRLNKIAESIASRRGGRVETHRNLAEQLCLQDYDEEESRRDKFGQQVRKVFPLGDLFVDTSRPESLERDLRRFIELVFGNHAHTPDRDEHGMFLAFAAARRSSALARQVGAAICTGDGSVVSIGCNEVPRAKGGLCWEGDEVDGREFTLGVDSNEEMRKQIVGEVLTVLQTASLLKSGVETQEVLAQTLPMMKYTHAMAINEFGRLVHAEMAAIVDAARRGVPVDSTTLYTTTFPCHECTRHIIAAGITRVLFVEPYPKSHASDLFAHQISIDDYIENPRLVNFRTFTGVSPSRYFQYFSFTERKEADGSMMKWAATTSVPRFHRTLEQYKEDELLVVQEFERDLEKIKPKGGK